MRINAAPLHSRDKFFSLACELLLSTSISLKISSIDDFTDQYVFIFDVYVVGGNLFLLVLKAKSIYLCLNVRLCNYLGVRECVCLESSRMIIIYTIMQ